MVYPLTWRRPADPQLTAAAMEPEEAAVPFAEFMEKVDMSMTGKLWAPSESSTFDGVWSDEGFTEHPDGTRGIGGAEEAMGKEWASKSGPLEIPW